MAEANTGNMMSELLDITECSICTETFQDPRILPCIHTFCLKCMQQVAKRGDKKPGDKLSCPICRKEITVADDEALGLQKNFFMARLIEMLKILKPVDKNPLCNICLLAEPEDSSAKIPPATMYCIDCRDNLCPECSMHHRKHKLSKDHKIISLGSEINEEELLEKSVLCFCDEHKKEQLKLYCIDCKMLVCVLCFVESHRLHDCRNVSKVADELRPQIIADISRVSNQVTEMFSQKEQLEKETTEFLSAIAQIENKILRRSSELKELVKKSTASILEELSAAKRQRLKEIESKKEEDETHLTILKTFQTYCNGIITKGSDSDVCRVVNDLCHRADELQKLHQSCISQNLPSMKVTFQIMKLDPSAITNIIGTINVDANLHGGNEEAEGAVDPAHEGFNTMELDIEEDGEEKMKRERSKDDCQERSDKERTPKKGKTGYNSRPEQEKPAARPKFDDQESTEAKEEFHYFSGKESPFHPHHKAEFQVDGVKYNFVEQYVLHKKAEMCKATKDAAELMKITDPNHLEQFERKFIVADAKSWETKHKEFMKKGYLEKSRQVVAFFILLQDTKGKNLVYATRKDFFLGIGVDANDPLSRCRSNWKGKNLLGEWLMEVREELPNQLESSFDNISSKQEATHGSPQHKETVKEKESTEAKEEFHYFSGKESPLHPHHKAEFQVDGIKYNFVEQYVLHKKAEMCKATRDAAELMKITDPNHLKQFEKKFIVADAKLWDAKRKEFMRKGYLEKSRQVKALFNLLQDTKGITIVYATRKDFFLGIGVDANDPLSRRKSNWKGKNLLGEWLMEVREEIPNQLESAFYGIALKQGGSDGSLQHKETVKEKESIGLEKFTFFWRMESPFSQWHPCSFVIDDQWYNCAEQYMMHQKAVMFGDHQTAQKILKSKDPKDQKHLGRKVANFDDKKWSPISIDVVRKGNLAKFGQNQKLRALLFETAGTTLVEASPVDNIWGIGLAKEDPRAKDRKQWLGKNQLGLVLTEVREELMHQRNRKEIVKEKESVDPEMFTFFWKKDSPFSQWHPSSFVIDDEWYNCAEQYMMHQKAMMFGDHESAHKILMSKDPQEQKRLGKNVTNLDSKKWGSISMAVVKRGSLAKFGQNENLKKLLFETAGTTLVEASPYDPKWGIGLEAEDPRAKDRKQWLGKNQLGQILTEVREELISHGMEKYS